MTQYTKPPVLPVWAETGETVQPTNAEVQTGWPSSITPPSRQRMNWILNYVAKAVRYFLQRGIPQWDAEEDYPVGAKVIHTDGLTYSALLGTGNINQNPITATTFWEKWGYSATQTDAGTGGFVKLTAFKINFKNAENTVTSFFTNANTAARTYIFPNRDGTIADDSDLALKANLISPAFTNTPTAPTAPVNTNTTQLATTQFTKAQIANDAAPKSNGKAVGDIFMHLGNTAPAGSLIVPIAATNISRTTYAALHSFVAALSYPWGSGDGSTTFGMPYVPANYALVQANANARTTTVGAVIAHTHSMGTSIAAPSGVIFSALRLSGSDDYTGSTGGSANLAAGTRVLFCVQYL